MGILDQGMAYACPTIWSVTCCVIPALHMLTDPTALRSLSLLQSSSCKTSFSKIPAETGLSLRRQLESV